jgi:mannose-6-phosphate isomerase-like protein (cupin superfamily)
MFNDVYPSRSRTAQELRETTVFETKSLPLERDATAPDGSDVRLLLALQGGSMAHFELPPGETSTAVTHRTVDEIWYFLTGSGKMWRQQDGVCKTIDVRAGVSLTIPVGTWFQFTSTGDDPLSAIGVTMPPWPGDGEAVLVRGPWQPTLPRRCNGGIASVG